MASILLALIVAARLLEADAPGGVPEPVRWAGAAIAISIALGRACVKLLGGD